MIYRTTWIRSAFTVPFDGVVTKCIVEELAGLLTGGRIEKIFQPEADEIIMHIRTRGESVKLLLSASANYPRIHLTETVKENPQVPPMFCMLLRKHLSGGRINAVRFHDYERIVTIHIESVSELGDVTEKKLVIEIMGRHSNIILLNSDDRIIDAIKHVDAEVSSVREVMPTRPYVLPPPQNKVSLESLDIDGFVDSASREIFSTVEKHLFQSIKGFSLFLCREVCHRAGLDSRLPFNRMTESQITMLKRVLHEVKDILAKSLFTPCIIYNGESGRSGPIDFHCIPITMHPDAKQMGSMSKVLDLFYYEKDRIERLKQKKNDIYKVLSNSIDRCAKKMGLLQETLREAADRETLRLYGELILANIYNIPQNSAKVSLLNYYSENGEYVDIPLEPHLSPQENAQRYFKRYAKAKSAFSHASQQLEETKKELEYLESVLQLLDNCETPQEIDEIRQELVSQGYIHQSKKIHQKRQVEESKPIRYKSSDGFDIYVGKNNRQNDLLTLKLASSGDIWLHTKNIPGSHVIIRKHKKEIPDSTLLEGAMLAAYYSKARHSSNVPVDYTTAKNVKKPPGAKPGMVTYENYKTIIVTPSEEQVSKLRRIT